MKNGFIKAAACSPKVNVADCEYNAQQIIAAIQEAQALEVQLLVFPELCITGYSCGDLFFQTTLVQGALDALSAITGATRGSSMLVFVGLPLRYHNKLYNCAAAVQNGRVLGIVPKTNLPNYKEFYEARQFAPAMEETKLLEEGFLANVPFGTQLLFCNVEIPDFIIGVEICEDLWVPFSPSVLHTAAGATVIVNLSASSELIGKSEYRHSLLSGHSGKLVTAYVYADANPTESTTDVVFSGNNMIYENGALLAEALPFSGEMAVSEIDIQRLMAERRELTTYPAACNIHYNQIYFSLPMQETNLTRTISSSPFIPGDTHLLEKRCEEAFMIQAAGLAKRIMHTNAQKIVLGISGGLDSTLALLAAVRTLEKLNRPASDIVAVTMPGFGTTQGTRNNASLLCEQLGVPLQTIDITPAVRQHFADINHSEQDLGVVYENGQARMRTLILMDLANKVNGLVLGTGDLSELALGWATYNGDHMSMYSINASVPKTFIPSMLRWEAKNRPAIKAAVEDIINTPVSPELLPAKDGQIAQVTEEIVGPYELHDFFLFYMLRWGFSPTKILQMAAIAFTGKYSKEEILHWMKIFYRRFFSQQFKRNCMPDGPKIGSISLSPRGDLRMPSDASGALWINEFEKIQ